MKKNYLELKQIENTCIVNKNSFTSSSYLEFEEHDVSFSLDVINKFQDRIYRCNLLFQEQIKNLFKNNTIELLNKIMLNSLSLHDIDPVCYMELPEFKRYFKTNYILPKELFQKNEKIFKTNSMLFYYINYGVN